MASLIRQQALGVANRKPVLHLTTLTRRPAVCRPRGRRAAVAPQALAAPGWASSLWPFGGQAAAPVAAAAAAAIVQPSQAFTAATVVVLPIYFAMIAFPTAKLTRRLIDSPLVPLLFAVPYALLAFQAWQGGALAAVEAAVRASAPLPDAAAIGAVFREPVLTAMAWLHLLLLDLLQARAVLLDGLKQTMPTGHSIALCCMFGPLGVLSHLVTRWAVHRSRGGRVKLAAFS